MTTSYAQDSSDPRGSAVPAVAAALLFLLGPLALALGGLSAMATDACGPDDCPAAPAPPLSVLFLVLTLPAG
ncbi:hypothetical protein [Streptomyces nogalater]|uniref:Uncharacterized protein n=1 Tax=Streptomyces nogalater TaxID=38314 RepID=A0ABW0WT01_STRNO